ncbi:GDSL-type esterase/lipase family protein [Kribbella sp. NPDC050124]|uniref:GDSL-type esterase/lipase family protein n=1 Tax=Kribbella sp. NPDC050124 TaxID=3364114 RepID=UPI0037A860BC
MTTPSRRAILGGALGGLVGGAVLGQPTDARASTADLTGMSTADFAESSSRRRWVASWATAQTAPTATDVDAMGGFTDTTIHNTVHLSAGTGSAGLRLRFANPFGVQPIVLGPVTANGQAVLFGGQKDVVVAAGGTVVSDPVDVMVPDGGDVQVSMYLPGPTGPVSFHRNTHATGLIGDRPTKSVFLLNGVDVRADGRRSLAVLGDSITEGVGTPDDANLRWPDQYAARFRRRPAVANLGVSGNRLLLDDGRFGPSGQARFDRDILALPGLQAVLVFLGINDIQQPPSQTDPARLLSGYEQLARRARDHDLEVLGATIGPFKGWIRYTDALDHVRNQVNAVLRSGRIFDRVVDVDAVLRDPSDPARLRPAFNSGDGLHPNAAGANAIALSL